MSEDVANLPDWATLGHRSLGRWMTALEQRTPDGRRAAAAA